MTILKVRSVAVAAATGLAVGIGLVAAPAQADELAAVEDEYVDGGVVVTVTTYLPSTIMESVVLNGPDADDFALAQAQAGRAVDMTRLTTAKMPGLTLVWDDGSVIDRVDLVKATALDDPDDVAESVEIVTSDVFALQPVVDPLITGAGLQTTVPSSIAAYDGGGCTDATISRGKLNYCRIKYKVKNNNSSYDFYFYDRWATANGNWNGTTKRNIPTKIDIRTRPKSSGSNINALLDYAPRNQIKKCNTVASISAGYGGASLGVPISECKDVTPYPSSSAKTMRVVFDQGAVFSGHTHAVEGGVTFRTSNGKTANAAHYNYVKFCAVSYLTCSTITKKQNGW